MSVKTVDQQLTKNKWLRFLFRFLFALVAFVVPTIIIGWKFELITNFSGKKFSAFALILIILIVWKFKTKLFEWINTWEYSVFKYILIGLSKIWIFGLLVLIVYVTKYGLDKFIYVIEWTAVCEAIAYLAIEPVEKHFDNKVQRLTRKKERKEDVKEAFSEM